MQFVKVCVRLSLWKKKLLKTPSQIWFGQNRIVVEKLCAKKFHRKLQNMSFSFQSIRKTCTRKLSREKLSFWAFKVWMKLANESYRGKNRACARKDELLSFKSSLELSQSFALPRLRLETTFLYYWRLQLSAWRRLQPCESRTPDCVRWFSDWWERLVASMTAMTCYCSSTQWLNARGLLLHMIEWKRLRTLEFRSPDDERCNNACGFFDWKACHSCARSSGNESSHPTFLMTTDLAITVAVRTTGP